MVKVRHWRIGYREKKVFGMDPILPRLERETRRRRRSPMFHHQRVPVRMLVPNFFTLLGLCAGLTSIRMSIEGRYEQQRVVQVQVRGDVASRLRRRRGSEGQDRTGAQGGYDLLQTQIRRAKIVTPLAHTVSFVNYKELRFQSHQEFSKPRQFQPLRRDIKETDFAGADLRQNPAGFARSQVRVQCHRS